MSEVIAIEKGVPIPRGRGGKPRYPWKAMEVGDSFVAPSDVSERAVYVNATLAGKSLGRRFSCRKLPCGSVRVWRVA